MESKDLQVSKLRASDGAKLGTFSVGTSPLWCAFDGANVWVSNTGTNTVTKIRARDGSVLGTFTVETGVVRQNLAQSLEAFACGVLALDFFVPRVVQVSNSRV